MCILTYSDFDTFPDFCDILGIYTPYVRPNFGTFAVSGLDIGFSDGGYIEISANQTVALDYSNPVDLSDTTPGGDVETRLGVILGTSEDQVLNVILYEADTPDATAALYEVDVSAGGADIAADNISVELIGLFNEVGANNLSADNFLVPA